MKKDIVIPSLVLFLICLISAGALAFTYQVTKPIIAERAAAEQEAARIAVLPGAPGFQPLEVSLSPPVTGVWSALPQGYVVTVAPKGYGGLLELTLGLNPQGQVVGIQFGPHTETPGLGSKMTEPAFWNQFLQKGSEEPLKLVKTGAQNPAEIDALAGATITSRAVVEGVQGAIEAVQSIIGGNHVQ